MLAAAPDVFVARSSSTELRHRILDSPVGDLVLLGDDDVLHGCWFAGSDLDDLPLGSTPRDDRALGRVADQLGEYFAGARTSFDLALAPEGTAFQMRVWAQLCAIPYGETCSYADIARAIGAENGFRAVGLANGRNPISIIVPCHRVVGADGSLTGYGGGLDRKRHLLDLEAGRASLL